jgi:hypothetical protein
LYVHAHGSRQAKAFSLSTSTIKEMGSAILDDYCADAPKQEPHRWKISRQGSGGGKELKFSTYYDDVLLEGDCP